MNETHTRIIFDTCGKINLIFKQYIIGKSIESLIIGIICFIGLQLLSVNYALLISIIIGITNFIPYFGSIIGLIPTLMITIFQGPISAVKLLVLVFILAQFDAWYLSPKIIGGKVGLKPIWLIAAMTIGGGIYGIMGMFLSVPAAAVIKALIEEYIQNIKSST